MGKSKKYVIISGLNLSDNNRGTAALGYGSISFLKSKGYLKDSHDLLNIRIFKNPFKKRNRNILLESLNIDDSQFCHLTINVFFLEYLLFLKLGILLPFSRFGNAVRDTDLVAAINGGDGFSDIYGTKMFLYRLVESYIALKNKIPLILLPQTLGPFKMEANKKIAAEILRYATKIYVRDDKFVDELNFLGLKYEQTKDLSYYMKPELWNITIPERAVGINVSGLAYSNNFHTLSGQFDAYKELIAQLIKCFAEKGNIIYIIPHSYNYQCPESNNDDMIACREAYEGIEDKSNVVLIDKDLTSPQIKYLISQMRFFIGTRMHANFAAIYTGVPVFGLSYSYKFLGAFNANGLDGNKQTVMINNIGVSDIPGIVSKIMYYYHSVIK